MKLLTITEAAQVLGLAKSTLYKKTSAKSIPFFKLGSRVLFDERALMTWAGLHRVQPIGYRTDFTIEGGNDAA
ncbi:MAG: helix-turn-helix domain-containing protein [Alkalispirochaeta sp.]